MLGVRENIFSPPKEKLYTRLKDELIKRTLTSQQKKLSQLLHEETLGDSTPLQFLRRLQQLAGENHEDGLIHHIFLERLPAEYRNILAAVAPEALIEKLTNIADNIADLNSLSTASISNVRTSELTDSVDKILEGLRKLEGRMAQVEGNLDKRITSRTQSRDRARGSNNAFLCHLHKKFGDKTHHCGPSCSFNEKQAKPKPPTGGDMVCWR